MLDLLDFLDYRLFLFLFSFVLGIFVKSLASFILYYFYIISLEKYHPQ